MDENGKKSHYYVYHFRSCFVYNFRYPSVAVLVVAVESMAIDFSEIMKPSFS